MNKIQKISAIVGIILSVIIGVVTVIVQHNINKGFKKCCNATLNNLGDFTA